MQSNKEYFTSEGTEREAFELFVNHAILAAESGDDLAAVGRLIAGADMVERFGSQLRKRVLERVRALDSTGEAIEHAGGVGEAMAVFG